MNNIFESIIELLAQGRVEEAVSSYAATMKITTEEARTAIQNLKQQEKETHANSKTVSNS